jgi:hypothetical protein
MTNAIHKIRRKRNRATVPLFNAPSSAINVRNKRTFIDLTFQMVQELYFIYKKTAFSKMEKARNRNKFIKELCLKKLGIER